MYRSFHFTTIALIFFSLISSSKPIHSYYLLFSLDNTTFKTIQTLQKCKIEWDFITFKNCGDDEEEEREEEEDYNCIEKRHEEDKKAKVSEL